MTITKYGAGRPEDIKQTWSPDDDGLDWNLGMWWDIEEGTKLGWREQRPRDIATVLKEHGGYELLEMVRHRLVTCS